MKPWLLLSFTLVAITLQQVSAARCNFYQDFFFGYTCELNDASTTEIGQELVINTDNHLNGLTDADVRRFTVNPETVSLAFFPSNILQQFTNLRYLHLDQSGLTELTPLENCGTIVSMFIRYSFVETIPAGIFDSCSSLLILDISDNRIRTIDDDAFATLEQLLELDINHNLLESINNRVFRNQVNLEEFNLRYNQISDIEDGAFSNLQSLVTFYLRNNRITEIRAEMFGDEISFVFFNVNNNLLTSVPRLPPRAPNLKYIHVLGNRIEEINADDFSFSYYNVTNIDLSINQLRRLSADAFEGLSTLDYIDVSYNQIEAIDNELFERVPTLYTFLAADNVCVNARFNNIRSIDQDALIQATFDRCYYHFFEPQLTIECNFIELPGFGYTCDLTGVVFQTFRDRFTITGTHVGERTDEDVTGLRIDGGNLARIPPTFFTTFPSLTHVSISNSGLEIVEANTFEQCGRITFLDLRHNRIRRLSSKSFENCNYVDELILDNNQITEIEPCNPFLLNVYQTTRLSMLNNICVNTYFLPPYDRWLIYDANEYVYPLLNRCFSFWFTFLDELN